jgi:hypothetical protein
VRVVSLACSNTEIVCALGCEHLLVGVDDHSDVPTVVVGRLPRVAAIIVSAATKEEARAHAVALARAAPRPAGVDVLGPAEAPLAILRGRYRFRLLVRAPRGFDIQTMIAEWFRASPPPRGSLRRTIDIDPQSFL